MQHQRTSRGPGILAALTLLLSLGAATAQEQGSYLTYKERVVEHTLANGLRLLILPRGPAPVVAVNTYVQVGAVHEVAGTTGVAHMMEHMAFKGTDLIGTTDYAAEKQVLDRIDTLVEELQAEQLRGEEADPARVDELEQAIAAAQKEADAFIRDDEWSQAISSYGGVGLNAATSWDATFYFCRLPSQYLEAWLLLESERFQFPVFREFYTERDVVKEERRSRTEDSARGAMLELFIGTAYMAHPYQHPPIGHMSDLRFLTRPEGEAFFKRHYTPGNMVIAIVGHVDPEWVIERVEHYFGDIPAGPPPEPVITQEPPQRGMRRVAYESNELPTVVMGFHKPSAGHPDEPAYAALQAILAGGRTARLYRSLVDEQRIARFVGATGELPGDRYPNLFAIFAVPMSDDEGNFKLDECEEGIWAEIVKLQREGVTEAELQRVKTKARAGFIRSLTSNLGLARSLTFYESVHGDWRELFSAADHIAAVTTEDVQRVARETLVRTNCTVARIEPARPPAWQEEPEGDETEEDQ